MSLDLYPSILENSSKAFCLFAEKVKEFQAGILPPSIENPIGVDGYAYLPTERVKLLPSSFIKASNIYIFHKWKISHNLANDNLGKYAAASSPSWILYNNQVPVLTSSIPFSDTQENELAFVFKPNIDNPELSISFSGMFDASDPDFLNVRQMRLGLRFTCYEVSSNETVNAWLRRKGISV
jgi:hypothetical protein